MKKILFGVLAFLMCVPLCFGAIGVQENGVSIGEATSINCSTGVTCTSDGSDVTLTRDEDASAAITSGSISGVTINNSVIGGTTPAAATFTAATLNSANAIVFEGATANDHETTIAVTDPTADRTLTIPNASVDLGALTAASLAAGSVVYGSELPSFVVAAGANTACTTTCGIATAICGLDAGTHVLVAANDALADSCLCNGAVS